MQSKAIGYNAQSKAMVIMNYEFVLKRNGKEVAREQGEEKVSELAKKLDLIVMKMK